MLSVSWGQVIDTCLNEDRTGIYRPTRRCEVLSLTIEAQVEAQVEGIKEGQVIGVSIAKYKIQL